MSYFLTMRKRSFAILIVLSVLTFPATHLVAQHPASQASAERASGTAGTPEANSHEANTAEGDENDAFRKSSVVRALGAKLGMNPDQAASAFEIVNFVALAGLLAWLLVKMLPKTFRDRNTGIQKRLVDARTATEEANARLGNVEARLAKLDGEIAAMRVQAEKDVAADEVRIKASVEDEKQKILAAAEHEIAAATVHARRELQRYAAELAIEQATRKLVITAETDRLLVQNFARRLGGDGNKEGQN